MSHNLWYNYRGQVITDPATYTPLVIGNAAATLSELTGGRYFVGLGAGGPFGKVMRPVSNKKLREAAQFIRKFTAGEEVEYDGQKVRSEHSRKRVPVYIAAGGTRSSQLAGEIGDGAFLMGGPPEAVKRKIELIEQWALKAGRGPSEIDILVRCWIYVAESKEKARREVAACLTQHCGLPGLRQDNPDPQIAEILQGVEREQPGILDDIRRVRDVWDPVWHEHIDAPHAKLVTQRMIDLIHLTGTPEDICEGIYQLHKVGVKTIATANYTIIDKKGMLREIGSKIIPQFRN